MQSLVDNLIDGVRSRLDLAQNEGIDDGADILPALNRAKDYAFNILARYYKEPLLTSRELEIASGEELFDIPEDAFEMRLLKVDWQTSANGTWEELDRLSYRQVQEYETHTPGIPSYYTIIGSQFQLIPKPQSGKIRIWILREPDDYVKSLGRITAIDDVNNKLSLHEINSALTTSTSTLGAYLNVVDGKTGIVKYSIQVKSIDEDNQQIEIKAVPSRDVVLGRPITGSLVDADISPDDHICSIAGTCIPYFRKPISNFCIEYATAEMKDKLERQGQDLAQSVLGKFEKQMERAWAARETSKRVRKENRHWFSHAGTHFLRTR